MMARTTRRIYSKRRKRSPNKMFAPQNTGPRIQRSAEEIAAARSKQEDNFNVANPWANGGGMDNMGGRGAQESQLLGRTGGLAGLFAKTQHPPYLGGKETGGSGVGGGKTYTITEA